MFPLTLGANIGTTITGILSATVVTSNPVEAWQVALCHLFFNLIGIAIWYPIPAMKTPLEKIETLKHESFRGSTLYKQQATQRKGVKAGSAGYKKGEAAGLGDGIIMPEE